jgi:uncharacterized protein (DUF2062 family)
MTWSRIKKTAQQVLHLGDPPSRTALAFAIGVFIGFSPLYGLHTIGVLLCAWAFRLNVVAMLAGSFINNPWTVLPILGTTMWVGLRIWPIDSTPPLDWTDFTFQMLGQQFYHFLLPFVLGSTLLGIMGALLAYPIVLLGLQRYRENQRRLSSALLGTFRDDTK